MYEIGESILSLKTFYDYFRNIHEIIKRKFWTRTKKESRVLSAVDSIKFTRET